MNTFYYLPLSLDAAVHLEQNGYLRTDNRMPPGQQQTPTHIVVNPVKKYYWATNDTAMLQLETPPQQTSLLDLALCQH